MRITILPADLDSQRDLIVETLSCDVSLTDQTSADLNGFTRHLRMVRRGRGWLWMGSQETVIGVAAAFPRRFYLGDEEVLGLGAGRFLFGSAISELRSGAAVAAGVLEVTEIERRGGLLRFSEREYGAVYNRLGIEVTAKMLRLAKLLRVDRKVKEVISSLARNALCAPSGIAFLK